MRYQIVRTMSIVE